MRRRLRAHGSRRRSRLPRLFSLLLGQLRFEAAPQLIQVEIGILCVVIFS